MTSASPLQTREYLIASDTAGISLYLRNKRLASGSGDPGRIVLFVHGSTIPAECSFDMPMGGRSWMDILAADGVDAWLIDVRGYGLSDKPAEMSVPADLNPPVVDTATALSDLAAGVDFICKLRQVDRLNLIGWSWGTTITGAFTAANNDKVAKLVLIAPQWTRESPSASDVGGVLGAYRTVRADQLEARWRTGVPAGAFTRLVPPSWLATWREALFGIDPSGPDQSGQPLLAPNGTVADSRAYWSAGRALYDPGAIQVPVLQVHAEWDADIPLEIARRYFATLVNAPYRRWIEIGEGTHSILLEKNRFQLFDAVARFLGEDFFPEA